MRRPTRLESRIVTNITTKMTGAEIAAPMMSPPANDRLSTEIAAVNSSERRTSSRFALLAHARMLAHAGRSRG